MEWIKPEDQLPERKNGWNHSERVLVWYRGNESNVDAYGVAYYHYNPPYSDPCFIDFARYGRQPNLWTPIEPPKL